MTDRYTDLVKQAYEAQMAREGEAYVALTGELTAIDADLEALSAKRETTISALESMDESVEGAKEALDAYFAGRDEDDAAELTESDDALFEAVTPLEPLRAYTDRDFLVGLQTEPGSRWPSSDAPNETDEDEYHTARAPNTN